MGQDDEANKVFDVSKPNRMAPSATSRPIITDNQPTMSDPMMREKPDVSESVPDDASASTPIHVAMDDDGPEQIMARAAAEESESPDATSAPNGEHASDSSGDATTNHETAHATATPPEGVPDVGEDFNPEVYNTYADPPSPADSIPKNSTSSVEHKFSFSQSDKGSGNEKHHFDQSPLIIDSASLQREDTPSLSAPRGAGPKHRWPKVLGWFASVFLMIIITFYLAIDLGIVQSDVKLPFSIFGKQKGLDDGASTPPPSSNAPAPTPPPSASIPLGFKQYQLSGTSVNFAYPTTWGNPTVSTDPGFTKRGGSNKTDGTHAYLISFATNKDVQIAVTSSKYLPAERDALYYDALQWCVGTNDGKFYNQTLHFASDGGVDTPSTIACDEGPLSGAAKVSGDDEAIVQLKVENTKGAIIGDLYTKNLSDEELTVLRVKDATMKNSEQIKQLLPTVKSDS